MKKRYLLLIAALVVCAGLCLWLLNGGGLCIGRMENRTDDQWSQLHVYMNDEITVDFPIEGTDRTCLFQYETGRGSFTVKITDAQGNIVYSDTTSESGSASFQTSSDLKLWISARGHGGAFSLLQRDEAFLYPNESVPTYGIQAKGTHSGDTFTATYDLRKADGAYMNFYVENRGNGPVVISINDEYDLTIPPTLAGHICSPIFSSIMPQTMTVKCITASDEDIDIFWSVAQRDNDTT